MPETITRQAANTLRSDMLQRYLLARASERLNRSK